MTLTRSDQSANAACAAMAALCDGGSLDLYDGPTRLVSVPLGDPAFASPAGGIAVLANAVEAEATASGTAATFQVRDRAANALWEGLVGEDLAIDNPDIQRSAKVRITRLTLEESKIAQEDRAWQT